MNPERTRREEEEHGRIRGVPFFPHHFLKETIVAFLVLGVVLALATFMSLEIPPPADPFSTPEHVKPEWYFLANYQLLKVAEVLSVLGAWAPKLLGVLIQGLILVALLSLPFLDPDPQPSPGRHWRIRLLLFIGLGLFLFLTVWGAIS